MEHHNPDIYGALALAGNEGASGDIPVSQGAGAQIVYQSAASVVAAATTHTANYTPGTFTLQTIVNGVTANTVLPFGVSADAGNLLTAGSDNKPFIDAEAVQDAIGLAIANGVGLSYQDALNAISAAAGALAVTDTNSIDLSLTAGAFPLSADLRIDPATDNVAVVTGSGLYVALTVQNSITGDGNGAAPLMLVGDMLSPGNNRVYGTDGAGSKGWQSNVPRRFQQAFASATSFTVNHSLNNATPDVKVWRTDVSPPREIVPATVSGNNANTATVTLSVARPVIIEVQG